MKNLIKLLPLAVVLALIMSLSSCSDDATAPGNGPYFNVSDSGYSSFDSARLREHLNTYPKEALSADEEASLMYMREEEKLAHDVYYYFYDIYSKQVFSNIGTSEQTHTDAVLALIERYELADPTWGLEPGHFLDTTLQHLYDTLSLAGRNDIVKAMSIGALIEEVDIVDLQNWELKVNNQDILMVYGNLEKGSRNHLRSFVRNLSQMGVTYSPQVLDQAEYDAIISSSIEKGN